MTTNSRSRSRKRKRVARSETGHSQAGGDGFVEVRGGNGRLLFRYDAARELVEVKPKGGEAEVVDLRRLRSDE